MMIAIGIFAVLALVMASGASASTNENCGTVRMSQDMVMQNLDRLSAMITSARPDEPGFEFMSRVMKVLAPTCAWSRSTIATIVGPEGSFEWQDLVQRAGSKTIAELAEDPEFQGLLEPPGKESVGQPNALAAAARFVGIDLGRIGL